MGGGLDWDTTTIMSNRESTGEGFTGTVLLPSWVIYSHARHWITNVLPGGPITRVEVMLKAGLSKSKLHWQDSESFPRIYFGASSCHSFVHLHISRDSRSYVLFKHIYTSQYLSSTRLNITLSIAPFGVS